MLNATITIAEVVGGILSGSLALLSDAVHNLSDTIAIALSYFANRIAQK
ncbi:MAG TPA: cation transporter, partial [Desulfosporosinus sp.]|nr:cation transporter [Desulfosporosinus sp.]